MCAAHARDREAFARAATPSLEIAPAAPVGIGHDGLAADLVEGDVLGRVARRRSAIGIAAKTRSGIARRPLQHLHAAHRAADDAEQALDAEAVEQHRLGAHHVADGDDREIERRRAGRSPGLVEAGPVVPMQPPMTLAQMTKKRSVSIGLPGPDHRVPPAGLAGDRMDVRHVLVAGQRVADQHRVRALPR